MGILYAAFICITIKEAFGHMFLCTFNTHRIYIDLACKENERIHIANAWTIKLNKTDRYCDDMTTEYTEEGFGPKYGVRNHMMHELITKCSSQRSCRVLYFTDYVMPREGASRDTIGIVIKYVCIPAVDFIPFCEDMSTKRLFTLPIFLLHNYKGSTTQDTCNCDVTYSGKFGVTLTLFPTDREYLKTTTLTKGSISREQHFKDRVYINEAIADNPMKETFTIVNRKVKTTDESAFILVQIAAHDSHSFFTLQCFGPIGKIRYIDTSMETENTDIHGRFQTTQRSKEDGTPPAPVTLYAVISSGSVICLLGFCLVLFLLRRRYAERKKQRAVNMPSGSNIVNPDATTVNTSNVHTTFYNDSIGSCSHSYAEVGSAAFGYIHCVMTDDISQQNVSVQMHYDIADGDNNDAQEQGSSDDEELENSIHMTIHADVINDRNNST